MNQASKLQIRNLAIIAHVDHGKTTLVDALLKQGQVFREGQETGTLIMDNNPLEKERGITILAKNTAVLYNDIKINIIDTPGHADFGGEVERTMNMADGCILVVDAIDGPMPQTRYVLKEALEQDVVPIVVINKIDRDSARIPDVIEMVQDLFLELATKAEQLDFPIILSSAKEGYAILNVNDTPKDMSPLFESIINHIPEPEGSANAPLQFLVTSLNYDNYLGQIAIGRITNGRIKPGDPVSVVNEKETLSTSKIEKVFVFHGLEKYSVDMAESGEIVALSGLDNLSIGLTVTDVDNPRPLPSINIAEPTVKMTFGVNTSPFSGQDGKYSTSRILYDRLIRELRTNISLNVERTENADVFLVSGRGELHLSILIETLRRENFEFQVSKPQPITKSIDKSTYEPIEHLEIETAESNFGALNDYLVNHLASLTNMEYDENNRVKIEYMIPTRGLIGFNTYFLKTTKGDGSKTSKFSEYVPMNGQIKSETTGLLVTSEPGVSVTFGLLNAQGRGSTFIDAGTPVYEGMVIGMHQRGKDISINVCKEKKLSNVRSSTSDIAKKLSPYIQMTLEETIDFITNDELIEVTPINIRIRKKELSSLMRQKQHTLR
jgi:GTP-binding protein